MFYLFFTNEEQEMLGSWHKYALLPHVPILSMMSENGGHKIGQWQRLWLCFFDFEAWIFIRLDEK